jgi:ankyrin repeat protein
MRYPGKLTSILILKYLVVNYGADVNAKDETGSTPLLEISKQEILNCSEILKILIEKGAADVNAKNNNGETPLHNACAWSSLKVVKCLVEKGADVNSKNNENHTPLDIAGKRNDIIEKDGIIQFLSHIKRGGGKFSKK